MVPHLDTTGRQEGLQDGSVNSRPMGCKSPLDNGQSSLCSHDGVCPKGTAAGFGGCSLNDHTCNCVILLGLGPLQMLNLSLWASGMLITG